jgi:hypothetical protein
MPARGPQLSYHEIIVRRPVSADKPKGDLEEIRVKMFLDSAGRVTSLQRTTQFFSKGLFYYYPQSNSHPFGNEFNFLYSANGTCLPQRKSSYTLAPEARWVEYDLELCRKIGKYIASNKEILECQKLYYLSEEDTKAGRIDISLPESQRTSLKAQCESRKSNDRIRRFFQENFRNG